MAVMRDWKICQFLAAALILILLVIFCQKVDRLITNQQDIQMQSKVVSPRVDVNVKKAASSAHHDFMDVNPVPSDDVLNKMTNGALIDFFHGYAMSTQTSCSRRLRMGRISDGGWDVCDDPSYRPTYKNCLVYSFGISNDFCFDDAIEKYYGCEVHAYDPSMEGVKDHLRGERIHFHALGIGEEDAVNMRNWTVRTFSTLRSMNHHSPSGKKVDILKMDVEGSEAPSLLKAIEDGSLKDVTQLSFETHNTRSDPSSKRMIRFLQLFRKLWNLGFRLYHSNRNLRNVYKSKMHGIQRTSCLELYMVNINLKKKK